MQYHEEDWRQNSFAFKHYDFPVSTDGDDINYKCCNHYVNALEILLIVMHLSVSVASYESGNKFIPWTHILNYKVWKLT